MPVRARRFIEWPVASRLLGSNYTARISTLGGLSITAGMLDALDRGLLFYGPYSNQVWEPGTVEVLRKLCTECTNVLIAGAHIGYMVLEARNAAPNATIHTFEPSPILFARAKQNCAVDRVRLNREALAAAPGVARFSGSDLRAHIDAKGETVAVTSVDAYTGGLFEFDFGLLDVEGNELAVLRGWSNLPQSLIVEVSSQTSSNETIESLVQYLLGQGYTLFCINEHVAAARLSRFQGSIEQLTKDRYVNLLATKLGLITLQKLGLSITST